jgi:hypothetical protein
MSTPRKSTKAAVTTPVVATATAASTAAPEADFDDTIARNRGLALLDAHSIPLPPRGYRSTDPDVRRARLRRFSGDLRAESMDALREGAGRDLAAELGRFAPDPRRLGALAERLTITGEAVARAESLLAYAREIDQIALSDAFALLDLENQQYTNAVAHDAALVAGYRALVRLFEARSAAIVAGMARARSGDAAAPAPNGDLPA